MRSNYSTTNISISTQHSAGACHWSWGRTPTSKGCANILLPRCSARAFFAQVPGPVHTRNACVMSDAVIWRLSRGAAACILCVVRITRCPHAHPNTTCQSLVKGSRWPPCTLQLWQCSCATDVPKTTSCGVQHPTQHRSHHSLQNREQLRAPLAVAPHALIRTQH